LSIIPIQSQTGKTTECVTHLDCQQTQGLRNKKKLTMMEESQLGLHKTEQEFTLRTATIADAQMITHYFQNNRAFLKPWEPVREEEFFTVEGWTKKLIKLEELHRM